MPTSEFSNWCVPRALEAVLPISRYKAARLLYRVQRLRGRVTAPRASVEDAAIVVSWIGPSVQPFDPLALEPTEPAEAYMARIRDRLRTRHARSEALNEPAAESGVLSLIESAPKRERPRLRETYRAKRPKYPTLGEWMLPGCWLISVDAAAGFHMLALRDGRVLAGGDEYGDCDVVQALMVNSHAS